MQTSLAKVVTEILQSAEGVSVASQELARGNADLSQRTENSASNLQQTASAMEQIYAMAQNSAGAAKRVTDLTTQATSRAAEGRSAIATSMGTMSALRESSRKMADIIGVIDAIAFQTNILALNAAVEAARAGEQGRGFNVVATEVRALATRSAASARQIKELIQTAVTEAEAGARSVEAIDQTMNSVVSSVNNVTEHVSNISHATAEQCQGISSVTQSVAEMDSATQQNSALVEEASAAANELQTQSKKLFQTVSVFQLPGQTHRA
jgi:methyl-accepting chemotaxis protein